MFQVFRLLGTYGSRLYAGLTEVKALSSLSKFSKIESAVLKAGKYVSAAKSSIMKILPRVIPVKGKAGALFKSVNLRKMGQLKKVVKNPYLGKVLNAGLTAAMFYPLVKEWMGDPEITSDPEAVKQIKEAEATYGVINELTPHATLTAYDALNSAPSSLENRFSQIVKNMMVDRSFLTGNGFDDSTMAQMNTLDDQERIYILSVLAGVAKGLCLDTDASEVLNAYRYQSCLSDQLFAVPTKGFELLLKKGLSTENVYEAAAMQYTETISSFAGELSQAAFQDFFDESTNIVFDFKDIFGGDTGSTWSAEKEEWAIQRVNAQVSCLSTDSNLNTITGWLDRFAVDSDGKDDESAALRTMLKYQSVSDNYRWFMRNIANAQASQASQFISQQ